MQMLAYSPPGGIGRGMKSLIIEMEIIMNIIIKILLLVVMDVVVVIVLKQRAEKRNKTPRKNKLFTKYLLPFC